MGIDAELGAVSSDPFHQHTGLTLYFIIGKDGQRFPDREVPYIFQSVKITELIDDAFPIENEDCKLPSKDFFFFSFVRRGDIPGNT